MAFDLLAGAIGTCATSRSRPAGPPSRPRSRPNPSVLPDAPRRGTRSRPRCGSSEFEGAGLDGLVAKDADGIYREGERGWLKVKHLRTADCVVAGFREHKDGKGVGSLLLGLYDDEGVLHHVGRGVELRRQDPQPSSSTELEPLPGRRARRPPVGRLGEREADEGDGQRRPGAPSRWNAKKDMSWEPLRIERVAEVAYEHMQGDRFRHTARFQRWRQDRDPGDVHLRAARGARADGAPRRSSASDLVAGTGSGTNARIVRRKPGSDPRVHHRDARGDVW